MNDGSYLWTGQRPYNPTTWRQTASRIAAVIFLFMILFFVLSG